MYYKLLLCFVLILLAISSCNQNEEGCLDITAVNFDASADKNCCCTYPELILNVNHVFEEEAFRLGQPYALNSQDSFVVNRLSLLFSNLHPQIGNERYIVSDTIHLPLFVDDEQTLMEVEDNFVLVHPNQFTYNIGTFQHPASYDGLEINFGLQSIIHSLAPSDVSDTTHILASNLDSIWSIEKKFFYLYMDITTDLHASDENKEVIIFGEENRLNLAYDTSFVAEIGADVNLNMKIDYQQLFQGVAFIEDDTSLIAQKIQQNIAQALDFNP